MRWGVYNEEVVLNAIEHECSGFILVLTDAVMNSRFILDIELPAMDRRIGSDPIFFGGAVFARNVGISQSASELRAASGVELGSLLGSPLATEDLDADLRRVAQAVLRSYLRSVLSDGEEPAVKLRDAKRRACRRPTPAPIHLSWSPPLAADLDGVGDHVWDDELLPALSDLRAGLEEVTQVRRLNVSGRPHLSAALALGFEFRAPTGWMLALHQDGLELDTARVEPDPAGWTLVRQPCSTGDDQRLVLCLHATEHHTRHARTLPITTTRASRVACAAARWPRTPDRRWSHG